jgi:hypothetical protein
MLVTAISKTTYFDYQALHLGNWPFPSSDTGQRDPGSCMHASTWDSLVREVNCR